MTIPEIFKYSAEHVWVDIEDDIATIGITDYEQDQLGEIIYVELPEVGVKISANDIFTEVESSITTSEIPCPVSGEIIEVNEELDDSPEIINEDAYSAWICKLIISDQTDIDALITASEYKDIIE